MLKVDDWIRVEGFFNPKRKLEENALSLYLCQNNIYIYHTYIWYTYKYIYIKIIYILYIYNLYQFSSVAQSCPTLWTPWTIARQASLSITNSQSLPKPMSIKSVMPSNHPILCRPLLLLPSIFPSIRIFSNESEKRKYKT